ncbi:hypothetical protein WJX73_000141 [Symbiochloris irregularis]|uniref:tRNA dimethylallyltransferase n=1 Tax=Symbiochloris irregularis TaxID=706552 RepID=A0AAW1PV35_9CHLO
MLVRSRNILTRCRSALEGHSTRESPCQQLHATCPESSAATVAAVPRRESKDPRKVLIITGPTAVGKTRVALEVARRLGGEIISADSVQVYKGLDVGSDKLPEEERCGISHHLLDVLNPKEEFSAADFFCRAREAAAQVLERGKVPIVAGGTGFYLRWFVHNRPQTPAPNPESAAIVESILNRAWQAAAEGKGAELTEEERWEAAAQAVATAGDPQAADKLRTEPNNHYRLRRMLEILVTSGRTLADMDLDRSAPLDYDFRCFFLNSPRIGLLRRIDARCETMVPRGLLEEAQMMLDMGIEPESNCASKSIGYSQAMLFLRQCHQDPALASAKGLLQMVADMQTASRQLSKRQLSWFRGDPMYQWVDAGRPLDDIVDEIIASVQLDQHRGAQPGSQQQLTQAEQSQLKRYQPVLHTLQGSVLDEAVSRLQLLVQPSAT